MTSVSARVLLATIEAVGGEARHHFDRTHRQVASSKRYLRSAKNGAEFEFLASSSSRQSCEELAWLLIQFEKAHGQVKIRRQ